MPEPAAGSRGRQWAPGLSGIFLILAIAGSAWMWSARLAHGQDMKETPLHAAALRDDAAAIRALLAKGARIDARDGWHTRLGVMFAANRVPARASASICGVRISRFSKPLQSARC